MEYEELQTLIDKGNSQGVYQFFETNRISPNIQDFQIGFSLLSYAVLFGTPEIVETLLAYGANPNQVSQNGYYPLYIAIQEDKSQISEMLLRNGANPNQSSQILIPYLFYLFQKYPRLYSQVLEWMPQLQSVVSLSDFKNAFLSNPEMANRLVQLIQTTIPFYNLYTEDNIYTLVLNDTNPLYTETTTPIFYTLMIPKFSKVIMTQLFQNGVNPDSRNRFGDTILSEAIRKTNLEAVKTVLKAGSNPNLPDHLGYTPYEIAFIEGNPEILDVLVEAGAKPELSIVKMSPWDIITVIRNTAKMNNTSLMRSLLKAIKKLIIDVDIDDYEDGSNAMTYAITNENPEMVKLLLRAGSETELENETGLTPLMIASNLGLTDIIRILIEGGADPDYYNGNGQTALTIAASEQANPDIVELLRELGSSIEVETENEDYTISALQYAVESNEYENVKRLLELGANPNIQNYETGNTPLMTALTDDAIYQTIVDELLKYENDLTIANWDSKTALDIVYCKSDEQNLETLIEYLQRRGYTRDKIDELLNRSQECTPKPLGKSRKYPRSNRAYTRMKRLLGATPPKLLQRIPTAPSTLLYPYYKSRSEFDDTLQRLVNIPEKTIETRVEIPVLNEFIVEPQCLCLDVRSGEYKNVAIPITRYGTSKFRGYYHTGEVEDAEFTWYYVEPDSEYYLLASRVYVGKNKLSTYIALNQMRRKNQLPEYRVLDSHKRVIAREMFIEEKDFGDLQRILEKLIRLGITNPYEIVQDDEIKYANGYTNYLEKDKSILFEGGGLDPLDEILFELARELGLDVIVLSHQAGNYGRLVSECLDVRPRKTSFARIVTTQK